MLRTRVLYPTLPPTSGSSVRMSGSTQRKKLRPEKVAVARDAPTMVAHASGSGTWALTSRILKKSAGWTAKSD